MGRLSYRYILYTSIGIYRFGSKHFYSNIFAYYDSDHILCRKYYYGDTRFKTIKIYLVEFIKMAGRYLFLNKKYMPSCVNII